MNSNGQPPLISVITPVLNGVKYIDQCIENVAVQATENLEHVIVDGGSTDGTLAHLSRAEEKYPHLRVIFARGSNQADSMNRGIAAAAGEIIGTLNVDDFYSAGVLEEVAKLFRDLPDPSFVVGNCRVLGRGDRLRYVSRPSELQLRTAVLCGFRKDCFPLNPASYFYHRSLHFRIGGYDAGLDSTLDVDFVLRAIQVARVRYVNREWGNFRLIPGTKTHRDFVRVGNGPSLIRPVVVKYMRALPLRERIKAKAVYYACFGFYKVCQPWRRALRALARAAVHRRPVEMAMAQKPRAKRRQLAI